MILDAGERIVFVFKSLDSLIVQIYVGDGDIAFKRIRIYCKAMVLRSYFHLSSRKIFDRLVSSAMPEFKLEGFSSERETQYLVSKANPENGLFPDKFSYVLRSILDRGRITGSV